MSDVAEHVKERDRSQWQGHRVAAMVLRVVVLLCPVSVAAFLGLLVSRSVPGGTTGAVVVRVVMTAAVSLVAFLLLQRLARRFLPLAALLRLNLVFPDRAPSRFSVALRSTSVRKLQQWVSEAHQPQDVAVLAENVVTLAAALNTHDRRTRGHCERTRALADLIVEELRLSPAEANQVRWGAFLHDIGKLVVPTEILNKPGKPTAREWDILRSHPEAGARLVEPLRTFLDSGVDAVGSHHENYDGSGYPAGTAGEDLPLAARIVSVADSFEVMTAVRAYKRPMTLQAAREELARASGTQFDPNVVRAFLNVSLGRLHWALGFAAWMAELPFLTVVPRIAAQMSAMAGGGTIAPVALPSIAAASLGAMAVVAHVDTPTTRSHPSAARAVASAPAEAAPTDRSTGSAPSSSPTTVPLLPTGFVPSPSSTGVTKVARPLVGAVRTAVANAASGVVSSISAAVPPVPGFLAVPLNGVEDSVGATVHTVEDAPGLVRQTVASALSTTAGIADSLPDADTPADDVTTTTLP